MMSLRSRCNLCQAKKKIQWCNSTDDEHCAGQYLLVGDGHHSHIFLNLGMSLTFVKLISLQAEYRKVMPKTTVRFVFQCFFLDAFDCLSLLNLLCCAIVFCDELAIIQCFSLRILRTSKFCKNYFKIKLTSLKVFY